MPTLIYRYASPMSLAPAANEVMDRDIDDAASVNELFRARARSASTLTGAGAGALAAGLLFSPTSVDLDLWGRLLGLVSVAALVVGTAAFVATSLAYVPSKTGAVFGNAALLERANNLLERLKMLMRVAKICSGVSVIFFLAAVTVLTLTPPAVVSVDVQRTAPDVDFAGCPQLPLNFAAVVNRSELRSGSASIALELEPGVCGADSSSVKLYLQRDVLLLVERG
jgi:hypothetical protein